MLDNFDSVFGESRGENHRHFSLLTPSQQSQERAQQLLDEYYKGNTLPVRSALAKSKPSQQDSRPLVAWMYQSILEDLLQPVHKAKASSNASLLSTFTLRREIAETIITKDDLLHIWPQGAFVHDGEDHFTLCGEPLHYTTKRALRGLWHSSLDKDLCSQCAVHQNEHSECLEPARNIKDGAYQFGLAHYYPNMMSRLVPALESAMSEYLAQGDASVVTDAAESVYKQIRHQTLTTACTLAADKIIGRTFCGRHIDLSEQIKCDWGVTTPLADILDERAWSWIIRQWTLQPPENPSVPWFFTLSLPDRIQGAIISYSSGVKTLDHTTPVRSGHR